MIRGGAKKKVVTVSLGGRKRRVQLPLKWSDETREDYQVFGDLSPDEKIHVIRSITEFPYFLHRIFLPDFCRREGKEWPDELWLHAQQLAWDYQRSIPESLLPFEVFDDERIQCDHVCRVAPNGTLKSTITSAALPLWLIGCNPEYIRVMLTSSKKDPQGTRHISLHKEQIVNNERFIEVFGKLRAEKSTRKWSAEAFQVDPAIRENDPTVSCHGVEGAIESLRADVGIADDCQVFHNAGTPEARAKQWLWLMQAFDKRLDTHAKVLLIVQTRHADDDFAGRTKIEAATTGSWDYKEYPAVYGEWPPQEDDFVDPTLPPNLKWREANLKDPERWRSHLLCPDVLPLDTLLQEWSMDSGRDAFFKTRLNKVRDPELKWFTRDDLKNWARADGGFRLDHTVRPQLTAWSTDTGRPTKGSAQMEELILADMVFDRLVVSIDTAATVPKAGRDPDYTVIQLWGLDIKYRRRVLLDMLRFRTSDPAVFKDRLKRFVDAYAPNFIVMETNGMAAWLGVDAQREIGYPIRSHNRGGKDIQEIEVFKDLAQTGLLLYAWGDVRSAEKMKPFEDELDAYPDGSHDDTLIAAVQAQELLRPITQEMRAYQPQKGNQVERVIVHQSDFEALYDKIAKLKEKVLAHEQRTAGSYA